MNQYTVSVNRTQTFRVFAETAEDASQYCLDGELIDDEIIDIFTSSIESGVIHEHHQKVGPNA